MHSICGKMGKASSQRRTAGLPGALVLLWQLRQPRAIPGSRTKAEPLQGDRAASLICLQIILESFPDHSSAPPACRPTYKNGKEI